MKHSYFKKYLSTIIVCFLLSACSSNSLSGKPDHFRGHFFDAEISGQKVIPIEGKASKPGLKNYIRYSNVTWQLAGKASNPLKVKPIPNQWTAEHLGAFESREVSIIPLQGQKKETTTGLHRSGDVMIGGSGAVSARKYMKDNHLPPGSYVIRYKVIGSKTWDRKEIYAEF